MGGLGLGCDLCRIGSRGVGLGGFGIGLRWSGLLITRGCPAKRSIRFLGLFAGLGVGCPSLWGRVSGELVEAVTTSFL